MAPVGSIKTAALGSVNVAPVKCGFVIFGATGNLAAQKLLPALYNLDRHDRLDEGVLIFGFGRREWTDEDWRGYVESVLRERMAAVLDEGVLARFLARQRFVKGDLETPEDYQELGARVSEDGMSMNLLFYLAIAPDMYAAVAEQLAAAELSDEFDGWRRLVVEKPFGYDLESAKLLDARLHRHFDEKHW